MVAIMEFMTTERACGDCCTRLVNFGVRLADAVILDNINLHFHCGELTAIIGPNGAGKTTLLRAMIGEIPHTGQLRFVHTITERRIQSPVIGYVPQRLDVDANAPVSVLDLFAGCITRRPIWISRKRKVREVARNALEIVKADQLLDRKMGQLSGGQLQRVLLALALTPVPDILLLDEPVSSVDQVGIDLFYEMVSRLRKDYHLSILLVSHDLPSTARVADRIIFLNRTILCDGTPHEALSCPAIQQMFGGDLAALAKLHEHTNTSSSPAAPRSAQCPEEPL